MTKKQKAAPPPDWYGIKPGIGAGVIGAWLTALACIAIVILTA